MSQGQNSLEGGYKGIISKGIRIKELIARALCKEC